jgi:hypothetical protein
MFEIIHDAEKDVAALIDSEFGRALGPIAMGEKAVHLLETFAGAHGVDPATIPTPELEGRWKEFVSTLSADVADAAGEAVKVGEAVLGGSGQAQADTPPPPAAEPAPGAEQVLPPPAGAEPVAASDAGQTPGETPPNEPGAPGPVTAAEPGHVICPTCDGWREVTEGGTVKTCPTCAGKGEVPIHEDAEYKPPTA